MSTQPTDAEIDELWRFEASKNWDSTLAMRTSFTRAVLARWGQPAHSGEPVECDCRNPYSHDECTQQAGCKIKTKLSRKTHQPVEQEPLRVKEIAEFVGTHEFGPEQLKWFRLGEAAHGIEKGGQHVE